MPKPALLMSRSILPHSRSTVSIAARMSASRVTSAVRYRTPAASPAWRDSAYTVYPRRTSSIAVYLPIPELPPVMTQTFMIKPPIGQMNRTILAQSRDRFNPVFRIFGAETRGSDVLWHKRSQKRGKVQYRRNSIEHSAHYSGFHAGDAERKRRKAYIAENF